MFQLKDRDLWAEKVLVDGKWKRITAKTKAELKKKLTNLDNNIKSGNTFSSMAEKWYDSKADKVAPKTYESYKPHKERAVGYFGNEDVDDITPAEIQAFIDDLANKGYAKDTVHRALVICNEIFDYAILQPNSKIRFNPCAAVKIPKGLKKSRREPPTDEQLKKITPNSEMGLFAWFLLYTGLRRGELLALKWEDIDRENKLIHVSKSIYFDGNQAHTKETKTVAGTRDVELLDVLAEVLPNRKHGYVFGGNEPWTAYQFNSKWTNWCKDIGLAEEIKTTHYNENNKHTYTTTKYKPMITCHQFRHEYASMLEDAGITEFNAKTALGHSSINITKDVYTHIRNKKSARIGSTLNEYIKEQEK